MQYFIGCYKQINQIRALAMTKVQVCPDMQGDIHTIYITCCWYKYEATLHLQSLVGEEPLRAIMRVFVCILSALALCQGNQMNITVSTVYYYAQILTYMCVKPLITTRSINALTEALSLR
jgi:hypothetical protein